MIQLAALPASGETLDEDLLVHANGLQIFDGKLGGDGAHAAEAADLAHRFIEHGGDDAAVEEPAAALEIRGDAESSDDTLARLITVEGEMHAAGVRGAAAKAGIGVAGLDHLRIRANTRRLQVPKPAPPRRFRAGDMRPR